MKVVITGAAGFIGCNAALRFLRRDWKVIAVDNLSRPGSEDNLAWLQDHGELDFVKVDIREAGAVENLFREHMDTDLILHFAAQVAVTTSVADPRSDFETNTLGTLNVLEAVRVFRIDAPLIFSSTNKVYGGIDDINVVEESERYRYEKGVFGISEMRGIDLHSPYGCSKGAADQYVHDYHRIYGLRTVVFRQSCVYGTRQFGVEDQGWIAWFMIARELGLKITIYGDGKQARDVLYVEDLLDAIDAAASRIDHTAGSIFNIGGGPANALSLRELIAFLDQTTDKTTRYQMAGWRPGDQRIYVSDIRKARAELGWQPRTRWREGVTLLQEWVHANRDLCAAVLSGRHKQATDLEPMRA
jgi:CDP-paratose 2-epimerase